MASDPGEFDLLRVPVLGAFLRWRHARTISQIPLFLVSLVMVVHGLFGPDLAPKNLATTLTWVHFRGALVLVLLAAGNLFCLSCPFMFVRQGARKLFRPRFEWPRPLRNKWVAVALFAGILFVYELFDLWSDPWWTACLIAGYFAAVLLVDGLFKHAVFCKFVCPIGQFNFIAATVSPLEVKVRQPSVCGACKTTDCIRGRRDPHNGLTILQRGCELALFQPRKTGNMDCTFCLECVNACPHDNIGILSRPPAEELTIDPRRSGIGFFSRRADLAALSIVFTFGALLNAFGMVSPVYSFERWLGGLMRTGREAPVLAVIFGIFLVAAPVALLGLAAWISRAWAGLRAGVGQLVIRYAYSLVPLGFGMWLAHYSFHFFTGLYTIVPLTQNALASIGWPILGEPRWTMVGLPLRYVQPLEMGFLLLGFAGSLVVAHRLAEGESPEQHLRVFAPWAAVCAILLVASVWLMWQPMDMRATFLEFS
ncbi:MAG TPA: hypothetical protein VHD76_06085 [Bryobacteraceae bacterium]|jgi:ferredoxin|nr:hypothetical protein [Bryobacteraceae bacterium]